MASESCRVLIVEDDASAALSMQLLLGMSGFDARIANDGRAGLEVATAFAPEVVICDLGLPGELDGLAVARGLRARGDEALLIAISGYGDPADREASRVAGFDHYFLKPVRMDVIERTIAAWRR